MPKFVNNRVYSVRGLGPGMTEDASGARADELAQYLPTVDSDEGQAHLDGQARPDLGGSSPDLDDQAEQTRRLNAVDAAAMSRWSDKLDGDPVTGSVTRTGPETPPNNLPSVGLTTAAVVKDDERAIPADDREVAAGAPASTSKFPSADDGDGEAGKLDGKAYDRHRKGALQDEVDRRNEDRDEGDRIEVNGTGSDGAVTKDDLVAALNADDEDNA